MPVLRSQRLTTRVLTFPRGCAPFQTFATKGVPALQAQLCLAWQPPLAPWRPCPPAFAAHARLAAYACGEAGQATTSSHPPSTPPAATALIPQPHHVDPAHPPPSHPASLIALTSCISVVLSPPAYVPPSPPHACVKHTFSHTSFQRTFRCVSLVCALCMHAVCALFSALKECHPWNPPCLMHAWAGRVQSALLHC